MRTIAAIIQELSLTPEQGLSPAHVAQSKQKCGANRLTPLPRESLWKKFLEKFDEPIIKILLAAALLSMVVDLFRASNLLGGISLGVVALAIAGTFLAKKGEWIPSLMFVSALRLFFVGLIDGHVLVYRLAEMCGC